MAAVMIFSLLANQITLFTVDNCLNQGKLTFRLNEFVNYIQIKTICQPNFPLTI